MSTAEIYALCDPDTEEVRYVGKANSAAKRLKTHLQERALHRPVNKWVRKLLDAGKAPVLKVLETVSRDQWEEAERRLIAEHRKGGRLLNLADGGAIPSQTKEQRQKAAQASNAAQSKARMKKHPAGIEFEKACFEMSRLLGSFMRTKSYFHAYKLRLIMKCNYAGRPDIHPKSWAAL